MAIFAIIYKITVTKKRQPRLSYFEFSRQEVNFIIISFCNVLIQYFVKLSSNFQDMKKILKQMYVCYLLVSLPSVKVIHDYKTVLSEYQSCQSSIKSIFPQISLFLKEPPHLLPSQFFPSSVLCHPGYFVSFCCPFIGDSLVGNVLLLVSGYHMLHFCMLVVGYFLTSNVHELV